MTTQSVAPIAGGESAIVVAALELSLKSWLVGISTSDRPKVVHRQVAGGDLRGLLAVLGEAAAQAERRCGRPAAVHVCFEAGRDGHWLHRALTAAGHAVSEIDPASIEVNRRRRRAKTDRIDLDRLVRVQWSLLRGEADVCRVVRVPSEAEEDAKRLHRERAQLVAERNGHVNRVKALLHLHGVRDVQPLRGDRLERLAALRDWAGRPLPRNLAAELARLCQRLALVLSMIATVEAARDALLAADAAPDPAANPAADPAADAANGPAPGAAAQAAVPARSLERMRALTRLRGIAGGFASVLVGELYYRDFDNRRQLGGYTGLAGCPHDSGGQRRELGIAKSGNVRARTALVELAWLWLRHQPMSALAAWFRHRVAEQTGKARRVAIVALARKLAVALWRYLTTGLLPHGVVLKPA
jgi:transposase